MAVIYNHFEAVAYFLDHDKSEAMFTTEAAAFDKAMEEGRLEDAKQPLLNLSNIVSRCLHEDWRLNLINEKRAALIAELEKQGVEYDSTKHHIEYQHFRPVKDEDFNNMILANREKYLAMKGKINPDDENEPEMPLFKIVPAVKKEQQKDGTIKDVPYEQVQFDLLRMNFDELSQSWKDANLKAAKYAIALIKTSLEKGALRGEPKKVFEDIEKMSHDVHIEWMIREEKWGDLKLFLPYELLKTEEQKKDAAQLMVIMKGISFQSDVLARNRAIVIRALKEVLAEYSDDDGFKKEIMDNLAAAQPYIDQYDAANTKRAKSFKKIVKKKTIEALAGKETFTFAELEQVAEIYYNEWRAQASVLMDLPAEYDNGYAEHPVAHERLNFKNIARYEMESLLKELLKEKAISAGLAEGIESIGNSKSEIGERIKKQNQTDFANYNAMMSGAAQPQ